MSENSIKNALQSLLTAFTNLAIVKIKSFDFSPILNNFKKLYDSFKSLDIEISESQKEILLERYCLYGKFGWTIPRNTPYLLRRKATSLKQADTYMSKFCTKKDMNIIFDKMEQNSKIDKLDIKESIFCYKKKQYKSCVLILFSIIDGLLIKIQAITTTQRRTVNTAKNKLKQFIEDKENYLFLLLHTQNVLTCIDSIYKSPDDFKRIFDFINRDTVSHGMMIRYVTKIDCDKVFLLLYNILYLLDFYKINIL